MIAPFITLFINLARGISLGEAVGAGAWCAVGSCTGGGHSPAAPTWGGGIMTLLEEWRLVLSVDAVSTL